MGERVELAWVSGRDGCSLSSFGKESSGMGRACALATFMIYRSVASLVP